MWVGQQQQQQQQQQLQLLPEISSARYETVGKSAENTASTIPRRIESFSILKPSASTLQAREKSFILRKTKGHGSTDKKDERLYSSIFARHQEHNDLHQQRQQEHDAICNVKMMHTLQKLLGPSVVVGQQSQLLQQH